MCTKVKFIAGFSLSAHFNGFVRNARLLRPLILIDCYLYNAICFRGVYELLTHSLFISIIVLNHA